MIDRGAVERCERLQKLGRGGSRRGVLERPMRGRLGLATSAGRRRLLTVGGCDDERLREKIGRSDAKTTSTSLVAHKDAEISQLLHSNIASMRMLSHSLSEEGFAHRRVVERAVLLRRSSCVALRQAKLYGRL